MHASKQLANDDAAAAEAKAEKYESKPKATASERASGKERSLLLM